MFIISKELFGGECTLQIICIFRSCSPSMNNRAFYTLYNLLHSVIITAFASSQTVTLIITIVIVFLIIPIAVLTSLQLPVSSSPCPLPLAHSLSMINLLPDRLYLGFLLTDSKLPSLHGHSESKSDDYEAASQRQLAIAAIATHGVAGSVGL